MTALVHDRLDTARMLLFLGASPFILSPTFESALNMAVEMDEHCLLLHMLGRPCRPELRERSLYIALVRAAENERSKIALLLLAAGANLNYSLQELDPPLNISAALGNLDMVKIWIDRGAPLERYDRRGFTPLMNAAAGGHLEICETLINNGASVRKFSAEGVNTALSLAKHTGIVDLLLSRIGIP
ncbi:hypothetical protein Aperf_G00000007625 [Anoplocephala perfoliata]